MGADFQPLPSHPDFHLYSNSTPSPREGELPSHTRSSIRLASPVVPWGKRGAFPVLTEAPHRILLLLPDWPSLPLVTRSTLIAQIRAVILNQWSGRFIISLPSYHPQTLHAACEKGRDSSPTPTRMKMWVIWFSRTVKSSNETVLSRPPQMRPVWRGWWVAFWALWLADCWWSTELKAQALSTPIVQNSELNRRFPEEGTPHGEAQSSWKGFRSAFKQNDLWSHMRFRLCFQLLTAFFTSYSTSGVCPMAVYLERQFPELKRRRQRTLVCCTTST